MTSIAPEIGSLYQATVMHQRFFDVHYRFRYRVFSLMLDIDHLDDIAQRLPLFSHNRFNVFSLHDRDHLPQGSQLGLRAYAESLLQAQGIDSAGLRIRLLCFPRVLNWVFNPLSLWFCENGEGGPVAVIAEVRNTFGERHCYVLKPANGDAPTWPLRDACAKDFHVSPFIDMSARYEFRIGRPEKRLAVAIREYSASRLMLVATQTGQRQSLTSLGLVRQSLRVPFQTAKVMVAIHWQALKIWLRGGTFYRKPEAPVEEIR